MLAKGLQGGEKQILEEAAESDGMRGEDGRSENIKRNEYYTKHDVNRR
jgi:hypothetical protein